MEELSPGTRLESGPIQAPGEAGGAEIIVESLHVAEPHGMRYRARQGSSSLLVTVFDDALVENADTRATLERSLAQARGITHRNLLPCYGFHRGGGRFIVAREDPRCTTAQELVLKRMVKGERIELSLVCSIAAQVCDALSALHEIMPHGNVTAANVFVNRKGRVYLSGSGEGRVVPLAPRFGEHVAAGLLPAGCRELFVSPYAPRAATDVFLVAELVVTLLSGHAAEGLQASLVAAGLNAGHPLHAFLEQALAEDPERRPCDIVEFRRCLITASRARTVDRFAPPPPPSAPIEVRAAPEGRSGGAGPQQRQQQQQQQPPPPPRTPPPPPPPPPSPEPLGIPTLVMPAPTFEAWAPGAPPSYEAGPPPMPRPAPRIADSPPPIRATPRKVTTSAPLVGGARPEVTDWHKLDLATASLPNATASAMSADIHAHGSAARAAAVVPDTLAELGLNLGSFDDIAERLSTIDGESGLLGIAEPRDGTGARLDDVELDKRARSDGFLGSFGDDGELSLAPPQTASQLARLAAPAFEHLVEPDPSERPPPDSLAYMLTRGGVDLGPFTMLQLIGMARRGELLSTEQITRRTDDHAALAVDFRELREIFEAKIALEQRRAASGTHRSSTAAGRRGAPAGRSGAGTAMWIVATLLLFAAAAWVMWQRSGAG